jgi:hypothetical protein
MASQVLSNYYENLQELLTGYSGFSKTTENPTETGKNREILVSSVLKQHLPSRASVVQGGIVIDSNNLSSGQIDVVICNSFSFLGGALEYGLIPVEAIIAAIEVKSSIDAQLKDAFYQLDKVKVLQKEIVSGMYDKSMEITRRTRRALTIAWFWEGNKSINMTCKHMADPRRFIDKTKYSGFMENTPNAIYVHNRYLLVADPCPNQESDEGTGNPSPFLMNFRDKKNVLRGKQYLGLRGVRDIYHFDKNSWNPLEVLLMWLSNEVNRYVWEIPDFAAYLNKP